MRSRLIILLFPFVWMGCSSNSNSNDSSNLADEAFQLIDVEPADVVASSNEAFISFRSGLSEEQVSVVADSSRPAAATELTSAVQTAVFWLSSEYGSIFEIVPPAQTTFEDTENVKLACESGNVDRQEYGNTFSREYILEFNDCEIGERTYNGIALVSNHKYSCTSGPNVEIELSDLVVQSNSGSASGNGLMSHQSSVLNCSSSAAGVSGGTTTTVLEMSSLVHETTAGVQHYKNLNLTNIRSTASTEERPDYQRVDINTQLRSPAFGERLITISTTEPIVINANPLYSNTGKVMVSASDSVEFELDRCNKDVVNVFTIVEDQVEQTQLSWFDTKNPIASFRQPLSFLTHDDNNSLFYEADAAYSAEQDLEGC